MLGKMRMKPLRPLPTSMHYYFINFTAISLDSTLTCIYIFMMIKKHAKLFLFKFINIISLLSERISYLKNILPREVAAQIIHDAASISLASIWRIIYLAAHCRRHIDADANMKGAFSLPMPADFISAAISLISYLCHARSLHLRLRSHYFYISFI